MKFFAVVCLILAMFGMALGLKDAICGLEHSVDGNGVIKCAAFMPKWSYKSASNECVEFIYGGCGGNDNKFGTKAECEEKCKE